MAKKHRPQAVVVMAARIVWSRKKVDSACPRDIPLHGHDFVYIRGAFHSRDSNSKGTNMFSSKGTSNGIGNKGTSIHHFTGNQCSLQLIYRVQGVGSSEHCVGTLSNVKRGQNDEGNHPRPYGQSEVETDN